MNLTDFSMIVFTVLAQMSVGAFVVLGVVHLVARARGRNAEEVDRLTDPALYAIGVTLVLGLLASVLHLGNPVNVFNVILNVGTSWLSNEIAFGLGFAALGFAFAAAQWFKVGSAGARQVLAGLTALVGLGLVFSMSMIYFTLDAVPAWNTWTTPVQFFITTFLLGSLAVGTALMSTVMWRRRRALAEGDEVASDPQTMELLTTSLKGIAIASVALLGTHVVVTPVHLAGLSSGEAAAVQSVAAYSAGWLAVWLSLVFIGAGLLAVFVYRFAATTREDPTRLAAVATIAFVFVLAGEFVGRSLFYESFALVGM